MYVCLFCLYFLPVLRPNQPLNNGVIKLVDLFAALFSFRTSLYLTHQRLFKVLSTRYFNTVREADVLSM